MKRTLLTTIALAISLTTQADSFYIKAGGGVNMMSKHKGRVQTYKSKTASLAEIGIGHNMSDNFRTDLTLTHYFTPEHKASTLIQNRPNKLSGKLKADINSLMVNVYVDPFSDIKSVKPFIGLGVGIATVKQKYSYQISSATGEILKTTSGSTKQANNFSYSFVIGIHRTVTDTIIGELSYSWNDFGKTKSRNNGPRTHYKGQNIIARLRSNI